MASEDRPPPPTITSVTGPLKDEAENLLTTVDYDLTVSAGDGYAGAADRMRSGVVRLELRADGQTIVGVDDVTGEEVRMEATQSCDVPDGSCPMTHTFKVPALSLEPGAHTIQPVAVDAIGHRTPLEAGAFPVTVRTDEEAPDLTKTSAADGPDGTINLHLEAEDGAPYDDPQGRLFGSGVTHTEIFLDGVLKRTIDTPCLRGGCKAVEEIVLNADGGLQQHEVVVISYDKAGHSRARRLGKPKSAFDRFGYNDGIFLEPDDLATTSVDEAQQVVDRAVQGAANTIRFPIVWCYAVNGAFRSAPPQAWTGWGQYDNLFARLRQRNEDSDPRNDGRRRPGAARGARRGPRARRDRRCLRSLQRADVQRSPPPLGCVRRRSARSVWPAP